MDNKLDEALCAEFPNLYRDRHKSKRETAMCWGFQSVGNGWYRLIHDLSEQLEVEILKIREDSRSDFCALAVKEKFGSLRFHMKASNDEMERLIDSAEEASYKICDICGELGNCDGYKTRCVEHLEY